MWRALLVSVLVSASASACKSSDECGEDEVQVVYLRGGDREGEVVCKPTPAACNGTASCGNIDCIREMYGYCEPPYTGVGCSDTFPPPIISCNP